MSMLPTRNSVDARHEFLYCITPTNENKLTEKMPTASWRPVRVSTFLVINDVYEINM